jgi:hypothetical protein
MGGTFVLYSWDIMEPIAYCMLLSNFTVGFFFYAYMKQEMQLTNLKSLIKHRFAERLYKKNNLDIDKLRALE